ncbi:MAG: ATP-binding cassette domain-containing protein [Bdellovibrionota bacterium]
MSSSKIKLKIDSLSFSYPGHEVFQDFSLDIEFESLLLMGPSGGGKSTLMRLLCGLELPESGTIAWDTEVLAHDEKGLRAFRKKTGVVFQSFNLFPHLSALENICLPLVKVHAVSQSEAEERAMEALKSFSLEDHALKMPAKLSGGQKQRVAILRAMITRPKLLFLDEPTSALDPYMTHEVFKMIADVERAHPCPVILVTHHVSFAQKCTAKHLF